MHAQGGLLGTGQGHTNIYIENAAAAAITSGHCNSQADRTTWQTELYQFLDFSLVSSIMERLYVVVGVGFDTRL